LKPSFIETQKMTRLGFCLIVTS